MWHNNIQGIGTEVMYYHSMEIYAQEQRADDNVHIRVARLDRLLGRLDPNVAGGVWFNEDVELGRCISRTVGIQCPHSEEVIICITLKKT